MENPDTTNIRKVWTKKTSRKIFLEIISGTQLRNCKQIKRLMIRKMNELMMNATLTDEQIYACFFKFIHVDLSPELRGQIQHKENYRNVNRAKKLMQLVNKFYGNPKSILDIGCDDGGITNVVSSLFQMSETSMHGCDIIPQTALSSPKFVYHLADTVTGKLPFEDETHDVVYAFMSLHHIQTVLITLNEIFRVLKKGGLFIIREHDCTSEDYAAILDIIHGFYSMVWSNPQEKKCFKDEYWSHYWTSHDLTANIIACGFEELMNTANKGCIMNPLRYYYAVYRKKE